MSSYHEQDYSLVFNTDMTITRVKSSTPRDSLCTVEKKAMKHMLGHGFGRAVEESLSPDLVPVGWQVGVALEGGQGRNPFFDVEGKAALTLIPTSSSSAEPGTLQPPLPRPLVDAVMSEYSRMFSLY